MGEGLDGREDEKWLTIENLKDIGSSLGGARSEPSLAAPRTGDYQMKCCITSGDELFSPCRGAVPGHVGAVGAMV